MGHQYLSRNPANRATSSLSLPRALALPSDPPVPGAAAENLTEPVLEALEIQGNILPGFSKPFQTLIFLRILDPTAAKSWLRTLVPRISNLREVFAFNRLFKSIAERRGSRDRAIRASWTNIAFSFAGLQKLAGDADRFTDPAFVQDMWRRSAEIGDPQHLDAPGAPTQWRVGGPERAADLVILLADDDLHEIRRATTDMIAALPPGVGLVASESGAAPTQAAGRGPFGFRDGISQPGVRGRISERDGDFLTPRLSPDHSHESKPGVPLVWPGEFVFGYAGPDPENPVTPATTTLAGPSWSRNGSFLVYRRLTQDVDLFDAMVVQISQELRSANSAFADWSPEKVGAKLFGRWAGGTPLMLSPDENIRSLEKSNEFGYTAFGSTTREADFGLRCPFAAHIRKANPRDDPRVEGGLSETLVHRMIRRGIPFQADVGERGLHFISYQTSIERQFEFVMNRWMNNPHFPEEATGVDPIIANSGGTGSMALRATTEDGHPVEARIQIPRGLVVPTGGGYFFAPSISALAYLSQDR